MYICSLMWVVYMVQCLFSWSKACISHCWDQQLCFQQRLVMTLALILSAHGLIYKFLYVLTGTKYVWTAETHQTAYSSVKHHFSNCSEICSVKTGCAVDMCVSTDDIERQIQSESEEIKDKRKQILYILNCLPLPKSNRTVCGILKETSSIILNAAPQCAVYLHK